MHGKERPGHSSQFLFMQAHKTAREWANDPIFLSFLELVFNVGLWPGAHSYRGPSQFSAIIWREEREHASSSLSEEQMLSVLRLTDFLPSDQQFHISLPYGATGHGGGKKYGLDLKSPLCPSISEKHLYDVEALKCIICLVAVVSPSPRGRRSSKTWQDARSVMMKFWCRRFIWIREAVEEFDNCDCLPSRAAN